MTAWHCPRCGYATTQPATVTMAAHRCHPPGRPVKTTALVRTDHPTDTSGNPGEHPTTTQRKSNANH